MLDYKDYKEYKLDFDINGVCSSLTDKHLKAYEIALETRKFEIELYWKRTTYFWTFIATTFTIYGLVAWKAPELEVHSYLTMISLLGFVLSLLWLFVNKGSKHWQENWEHHVDMLEDDITGPLFKTTLHRRRPTLREFGTFLNFVISGPARFSVSKINQLISWYMILIWTCLFLKSTSVISISDNNFQYIVIGLNLIFLIFIIFSSRTFDKPHEHTRHVRTSTMIDRNDQNLKKASSTEEQNQ